MCAEIPPSQVRACGILELLPRLQDEGDAVEAGGPFAQRLAGRQLRPGKGDCIDLVRDLQVVPLVQASHLSEGQDINES